MFKVNNPLWDSIRPKKKKTRKDRKKRSKECRSMFGMKADVIEVKRMTGERFFAAYLCGAAEVIVIDLFYCLEVDYTLQFGLMFVCREEEEEGKKKHLLV